MILYSLLIAEDEVWIRELLVSSNFWEKCGITKIWEAKNGHEALDILKSEKVDFVLTDILMPMMDGLDLLAKTKEMSPETEVVILTGFDEFNYVRTAMRLGAYDYLLKPIRDEEFMQLFNKLTHTKSQKKLELYNTVIEQTKWKQSRSLLQEQFLASWFSGRITTPTVIKEKCNEMEISSNVESLIFCLIELDQLYLLRERYNESDIELLKYGIRNIIDEHLVESGLHYHLFAMDQRIALWVKDCKIESEIEVILGNIRNNIRKYLKVTVSIGISLKHNSLDAAFKAYLEAVHSLKMKMYMGKDQIYFFAQVQFRDDRQLFHREIQQRLENSVMMGSIKDVQFILEAVFNEIHRKQISKTNLDKIVWLMTQILWEKKETSEDIFNKLSALETIEEVQSALTAEFMQTLYETAEKRSHKKNKIIFDILIDLNEHYKEELTLQDLSEKYYVNPSYLSRLFKEETGQIFTKYLMQLRVEKAKKLLETTHMKIYEISEEVGYADVKYFNKIFKKFTALTPADYREMYPK